VKRLGLLVVFAAVAGVAIGLYVGGYRWPPPQANPGTPEAVADFPDPTTFQSGDFVWPKKKGAAIPYSVPNASKEEMEWNTQHDRFVRDAALQGEVQADVLAKLKEMHFSDYEHSYFEGQSPNPSGEAAGSRSSGRATVAVGHVGILEIDPEGVAYVIEAIPASPTSAVGQSGVIRVRYAEWLKDLDGYQVWHGRVRRLDRAIRRKIADEALKHLGKPYQFFNFNLDDDGGFYCSKLAWMSTWRGTNIALDNNPDPQRGTKFPPWYSPRQLTNAQEIEMLHKPGEY
jgi:uncharacterized protein YycO